MKRKVTTSNKKPKSKFIRNPYNPLLHPTKNARFNLKNNRKFAIRNAVITLIIFILFFIYSAHVLNQEEGQETVETPQENSQLNKADNQLKNTSQQLQQTTNNLK